MLFRIRLHYGNIIEYNLGAIESGKSQEENNRLNRLTTKESTRLGLANGLSWSEMDVSE